MFRRPISTNSCAQWYITALQEVEIRRLVVQFSPGKKMMTPPISTKKAGRGGLRPSSYVGWET
jgi:hypothetical protein